MKTRKPLKGYAAALIIELSGVALTASGIIVELQTVADFGHVLITVGSTLIAAGSLLWTKVLKRK